MAGSVDISQAKVIVSGGRGTKEKDKYNDVIVNLAARSLAASTRPASRRGRGLDGTARRVRVGSSGKTVAPVLYVAAGISGAIQHVAGHEGLAVHRRHQQGPGGPDIQLSRHYGIVGDLFESSPR